MALFPSARSFLNGLFFVTLPLPALFGLQHWGVDALLAEPWLLAAVSGATLFHLWAAFAHGTRSVVPAGVCATLATSALALAGWWSSPFATLTVALLATSLLFVLLEQFETGTHEDVLPWIHGGRVRGALIAAAPAGLVSMSGGAAGLPAWCLSLVSVLAYAELVAWLWRRRSRGHWRRPERWVFLMMLAGIGACLLLFAGWPGSFGVLGVVGGFAALEIPRQEKGGMTLSGGWWEIIFGHPARLLVATFVGLCLTGTVLLLLAWSTPSDVALAPIDAAFTAVSAVCVTGLSVVDTPKTFTFLGQFFIALLIQVGGLGIMTFSTTAMRLLGQRMSMRHEAVVAGMISPQDRSSLFSSARNILLTTAVVEGVGALLLFGGFLAAGDGFGKALWQAIFTAISAFCNAGFALHGQSLMAYQTSPLILHTVAMLIILGGISPVVAALIPFTKDGRTKMRALSVQSKLILATSALLLATGFFGFLLFEWDGALAPLAWYDKLHNAWLQSATLRTAGFNSVSLLALQPATLFIMMSLMFIGGGPGSTAGGVKVTTLAILTLAVSSAVQGRPHIEIFGKRIPHQTVYRAAAIFMVGLAMVALFFVLVIQTQDMPVRMALFEVISGLGTVGLTIGGTERLDEVGKGLLIACMFLGRVGPLTLFMFLGTRQPMTLAWKRPEEDVEVG